MAFKTRQPALVATFGAERHISTGATYRTGLLSKVGRGSASGFVAPSSNPYARSFGGMRDPALSPAHALPLAFPPTGRLPSTLSATDLWSALFEASQVLCSRHRGRDAHYWAPPAVG